jgi:hypothetical protein
MIMAITKESKVTKKTLVAELKEFPLYASKKESTLMVNKKEVLQKMLNECLGISDEEFIAKQAEIEAAKPPKKPVIHRKKSEVGFTVGMDFKEFADPEWLDENGEVILATDKDLLHFAFGWKQFDSSKLEVVQDGKFDALDLEKED